MEKTKEQISFNMQQVKNKDSKIEVLLRKELCSRGLRYRKNVNHIYGKPDIVFIGKKVAVFATVNSGTDTIGMNVRKTLNRIKNFGYRRLSGIWSVTPK